MISRVEIKNFKCFECLDVKMKALNLFTGLNGMGKSTLIQSLLLLRQTYEKYEESDWDFPVFNGKFINLGTAKDVPYWYRADENVEISVTEDEGHLWGIKWKDEGQIDEPIDQDIEYNSSLLSNRFEYVSAERLGPRRYYDNIENIFFDTYTVGVRGENTVTCLNDLGSKVKVYENLKHPSESSDLLDLQMNAWMSEISPGVRIKTVPYFDVDLMGLRYLSNSRMGEESASPLNMGFGVSYVLPILTAILKAKNGDLLILENPEAHIHPRGQRRIGEMVALAAANGVQIIMETHSDHVLNGIRLAVKNNNIDKDQVALNYFYAFIDDKGMIRHDKTSPRILEDGSLSNWPDGFFDEWDKAVDELF